MADRVDVINADVVWRANTGQAEVDVERLRRQFHETTDHMSTDALRAATAQDRLDKALLRHGPASREAKQAEVQYRQAVDQATHSANRNSAALGHQDRQLERVGRGALVGSGALHGFARAAVFASTSFLGAAGLTYALRTSVDAASNLAEQTSKNEEIFGRSAPLVLKWGTTTATGIGIANDKALEATGTFGNLFDTVGLLPAKNAQLSRSLVQLGADLASFNNASPEETLDALRSGLIGEAEPLRRFGVLLSENRVKQEALRETGKKNANDLTDQEKLLARYALILKDTSKAQGDFARTQDGQANSQRQLSAEIRDTEAAIGKALLPSVKEITHEIRDYLGDAENQRRIQHDVNEAVRVGGQVAHGFARGLQDIRTVAGPVVDELGGVERTAKLVLEAFAVYKLVKIAGAIRGLGFAWRFVGREATIAAAAEEGAAVAGAGGAAGGVAGGAGRGFLLRGGLLGAGIAGAALALGQRGETGTHVGGPLDVSVGPGDGVSYKDPVTGKYVAVGGFHGKSPKSLEDFIRADILKRHPELVPPQVTGEDVAQRGAGARQQHANTGSRDTSGGGTGRLGLNARFARAELALAKAREARDPAAERRALRDEVEIIREEIDSKKKAFNDKAALYDELTQVEDQIQALNDDAARKRKARADKEAAAAKKRAADAKAAARVRHDAIRAGIALEERRRQNALEKAGLTATLADDKKAAAALIDFYRRESHDRRLTDKEREDFVAKELRAEKAARAKKKAKVAGGTDFFTEAAAEFRTYGSNISQDGLLSGQDARGLLGEIAMLLRENNRHSKETAGHTSKIKSGPDPMTVARAFAGQGL